MPKYEVGFPANPPVQAYVDLARGIASSDFGGGRIALPAWVGGGYALKVVFGDGEITPVGAQPRTEDEMAKSAQHLQPEQIGRINEAYKEVFGSEPEAQPQIVDGHLVAGSDLSVWLRAVVIPLAIKGLEKVLEALRAYQNK